MKTLKDKIVPTIGLHNHEKRHQWLIGQLQALANGSRLLDAGAGEQFYKKYCTHLNYVSQDFAAYIPNKEEKGLQGTEWNYEGINIISDITSIPEPDESFDAVICTEVLEHLPYPSDAIKEFSRLLKPGGNLLITAPFCALTHMAPYFYSTGFSPYYYQKILDDCGFEIEEIVPNGSFFSYLAQENRRLISMAKAHTKTTMSLYNKFVLFLHLKVLNRLEKKDINSHETLCYGYFVKAKKK